MHKKNGFGTEFRLTTPSSFQYIYKNAKKFRQGGFSILACPNQLTHSRIGINISKKQVPRAVDRNRIRRIIREFFRTRQQMLPVSLDMIFVVYAESLGLSNIEIRTWLELLWKKLISFYEKV